MKSKKSCICYFTGVSDSHLGQFVCLFVFLEEQEDKTQVKSDV